MNLMSILDDDIQAFIKANIKADIKALGLKKSPHNTWPYKEILNQISARQKAQNKLPDWASNFDLLMPAPSVIEQASSHATAIHKATWITQNIEKSEHFIDLTGGGGIDSAALAEHFKSGVVIDADSPTADILDHNLKTLGRTHVTVKNETAETFLQQCSNADLIYIDPARRDQNRKGHFKFEDCSPDIVALMPLMLEKSRNILIKASPMLDIHQILKHLPHVKSVICVEWDKQCKEVLYHIQARYDGQHNIRAVSLNGDGRVQASHHFEVNEEKACTSVYSPPLTYLYDPGPAFMKAGGFNTLARDFGLQKLHPSTHLYTSDTMNPDFPGRIFKIDTVFQSSQKDFGITKANIITRNYPLTPDAFKKKYKLKDGGEHYLFACTATSGVAKPKDPKVIILAKRATKT